jgi:hypothetical protein
MSFARRPTDLGAGCGGCKSGVEAVPALAARRDAHCSFCGLASRRRRAVHCRRDCAELSVTDRRQAAAELDRRSGRGGGTLFGGRPRARPIPILSAGLQGRAKVSIRNRSDAIALCDNAEPNPVGLVALVGLF